MCFLLSWWKILPYLIKPTFLQKKKLKLFPDSKEVIIFYCSHLLSKSLSALGSDQLLLFAPGLSPQQHRLYRRVSLIPQMRTNSRQKNLIGKKYKPLQKLEVLLFFSRCFHYWGRGSLQALKPQPNQRLPKFVSLGKIVYFSLACCFDLGAIFC